MLIKVIQVHHIATGARHLMNKMFPSTAVSLKTALCL